MKCILLAAGYATRLYPLTENFPKPLLKVGGRGGVPEKTILDWLMDDIGGEADEFVAGGLHGVTSRAEAFRQMADNRIGIEFGKLGVGLLVLRALDLHALHVATGEVAEGGNGLRTVREFVKGLEEAVAGVVDLSLLEKSAGIAELDLAYARRLLRRHRRFHFSAKGVNKNRADCLGALAGIGRPIAFRILHVDV